MLVSGKGIYRTDNIYMYISLLDLVLHGLGWYCKGRKGLLVNEIFHPVWGPKSSPEKKTGCLEDGK